MNLGDHGSVPFAVIAVTLLVMASVCAAVAAGYERASDNAGLVEEETALLDRAGSEFERHIERGLGEIVRSLSTDASLGGLRDRVAEFESRAGSWLEWQFPLADSGVTADLESFELELGAERLRGADMEDPDGYVPAYLKGSGEVVIEMRSHAGRAVQTLEILTDGSYGLPLADGRASLFEGMAGGDGVSVERMMAYQLTCLAEHRVLNGYGAQSQYGEKGTMSIITAEDVEASYRNAVDALSMMCFRCPSGDLGPSGAVDLADVIVCGDGEMTLDLSSLYSQALLSSVDSLTLKWYDYLCGGAVIESVTGLFVRGPSILTIIGTILGGGSSDASDYIEEIMQENGVDESRYRYIGGGTLRGTVAGYEVAVEMPVVDLFATDWMKKIHVDPDAKESTTEFIRDVLRAAAMKVGSSKGIGPISVPVDPSDPVSYPEALRAAMETAVERFEKGVPRIVIDSLAHAEYGDPVYGKVADEVLSHAESALLRDSMLASIASALEAAGAKDPDGIVSSGAADALVGEYVRTAYRDLAAYEDLRNVPGGQPGIAKKLFTAICSNALSFADAMSDVTGNVSAMVEEMCDSAYMMAGGPMELPTSTSFRLMDDEGNRTAEKLNAVVTADPVALPPTIVPGKSVHMTALSDDYAAPYSTSFLVKLTGSVTYAVEGTGGLSAAMGSASSALNGSTRHDISLEIPVASGWPLAGIAYKPSATFIDDLAPVLCEFLGPLLEPLKEIMRILSECTAAIAETLTDICSYVAEAVETMLGTVNNPMEMFQAWAMDSATEFLAEAGIGLAYALGLDKQSVSLSLSGYTLEISADGLSMLGKTKTVVSATLSGPLFGMQAMAGVSLKCRGELNARNVTVTGSFGLEGDGWDVSGKIDPFMKASKHLLTMGASIGDADIDVVVPDMDEYNQMGFALSSIPGIGEALSNIPLPVLGVKASIDAGLDLKYQDPTKNGLVINEVEVNPPGEDRGAEWVELFNNSHQSIDLDGYSLIASSNRAKKVLALSGSIGPGELMVVEPKFAMVNGASGSLKNGEILTLKGPEGDVVDKTPSLPDSANDSMTWHRMYDGSTEWEFGEGTPETRAQRQITDSFLSISALKEIAWDSVVSAFSKVGSITDPASMQRLIELIVKSIIDEVIDRAVSRLVEASLFLEVDVEDLSGSASGGVRIALRADESLARDILRYIAGKFEEIVMGFSNPYRIDPVRMFTENIDLEVTVHARIGYPQFMSRAADALPQADFGVTFRANIAAISSVLGVDSGKPSIECGIRFIGCPAAVIPPALSPDPDMDHDLWLVRCTVTWRRRVLRPRAHRLLYHDAIGVGYGGNGLQDTDGPHIRGAHGESVPQGIQDPQERHKRPGRAQEDRPRQGHRLGGHCGHHPPGIQGQVPPHRQGGGLHARADRHRHRHRPLQEGARCGQLVRHQRREAQEQLAPVHQALQGPRDHRGRQEVLLREAELLCQQDLGRLTVPSGRQEQAQEAPRRGPQDPHHRGRRVPQRGEEQPRHGAVHRGARGGPVPLHHQGHHRRPRGGRLEEVPDRRHPRPAGQGVREEERHREAGRPRPEVPHRRHGVRHRPVGDLRLRPRRAGEAPGEYPIQLRGRHHHRGREQIGPRHQGQRQAEILVPERGRHGSAHRRDTGPHAQDFPREVRGCGAMADGPAFSKEYAEYFDRLNAMNARCYEIAEQARKKGYDPEDRVEIPQAEDLASRVEKLLMDYQVEGVAEDIRRLTLEYGNRELVALMVAKEMAKRPAESMEKALDRAVRVGLAVLTEGILVAPLEGIADTKIGMNDDGTNYVDLIFAGPIRAAGGTGQAMSVLIADVVRTELGIGKYKPTEGEISRFDEEIPLYKQCQHLQYTPTSEEIDLIVRNCPVCVDGEGTEQMEISGFRDLPRIETNRVRGGACLVIAEGMCQKAAKLKKHVDKIGLDGWDFIGKFLDAHKTVAKDAGKDAVKKVEPQFKYLKDIVAGRPIFGHPCRVGGFRLRYGRARTSGLASLAYNTGTMYAMDEFMALGTQLKIERPGKACVVTPCDMLEGPTLLLKNGDLVYCHTKDDVLAVKDRIAEIVDNGEILVPFGEFCENNHTLVPCGYPIEWHKLELKAKGDLPDDWQDPTYARAKEMCATMGVPLHPKFNLFWSDWELERLQALRQHIIETGQFDGRTLTVANVHEHKRMLEDLCALHTVEGDRLRICEKYSEPVLDALGIDHSGERLAPGRDLAGATVLEAVSAAAGYEIRARAMTRVGTRMGRPEKAKERELTPKVHVLFPVGKNAENGKEIRTAIAYCKSSNGLKRATEPVVNVEVGHRRCPGCGAVTFRNWCRDCNLHTRYTPMKNEFGNLGPAPMDINIEDELIEATKMVDERTPAEIKCLDVLKSITKPVEPIEKGILRQKNGVSIFKDGTVRFDMTDIPLTHFKPREIGLSIEKAHELGYTHDWNGDPLTDPEQIVELKVQDVIPAKDCGDYMVKIARYVDDELEELYKMPRYYNVHNRYDLIGHIVFGLAPHTSGCILCRIIGYADLRGCYGHPFFHAAKRRNCDGDEDCLILAMDGLLNFSRGYLPSTRGGLMDAPLVLTTRLDPNEIDKEAHNVDCLREYPLELYHAAMEMKEPKEIEKIMDLIAGRIGTEKQYEGMGFTHDTHDISDGPKYSAYTTLESMMDKMDAQLMLGKKIRAVDEKDVAVRVLNKHFMPDMIGNLRSFSSQTVRCTKCGAKYRRVPLTGKCTTPNCGNDLILTVHEASVRKYLEISKTIGEKYGLDDYTRERIEILEMSMDSVFNNDKVKKCKLSDFFRSALISIIRRTIMEGPLRAPPSKVSDLVLEFLRLFGEDLAGLGKGLLGGEGSVRLELEDEVAVIPADRDAVALAEGLDAAPLEAAVQVALDGDLPALDGQRLGVLVRYGDQGLVLLVLGVDLDVGHVLVADAVGDLPLHMLLRGSHDGVGVNHHGLSVGQLDYGDVLVLDLHLGVAEGHEVAGEHGARSDLVQAVHEVAAGASLSTAGALVPEDELVQGGDGDHSEPVGDDLVEQGRHALVLLVLVHDGAEVELHLVDRHLGYVGQEGPPERVGHGGRGVLEDELCLPLCHFDDFYLHG